MDEITTRDDFRTNSAESNSTNVGSTLFTSIKKRDSERSVHGPSFLTPIQCISPKNQLISSHKQNLEVVMESKETINMELMS